MTVQKFVTKRGQAKEKKLYVMQDVTGSRQEFLATFKRKILEWLPHRRHKLWDDTWGKTRPARAS